MTANQVTNDFPKKLKTANPVIQDMGVWATGLGKTTWVSPISKG